MTSEFDTSDPLGALMAEWRQTSNLFWAGAVWAPLQPVSLLMISFPPGPGWVCVWVILIYQLFGFRLPARWRGCVVSSLSCCLLFFLLFELAFVVFDFAFIG